MVEVESPRDSAGRSAAKPKKRDLPAEATARREAALDQAALRFKALGDPTRLRIIRLLSGDSPAGDAIEAEKPAEKATERPADTPKASDGLTVGDVSVGLFGKAKVSSTLSHHLKELRNAGLITMKRRGKNLICRIQPDALDDLRCYLALVREPAAPSARRAKKKQGETRDAASDTPDDAALA